MYNCTGVDCHTAQNKERYDSFRPHNRHPCREETPKLEP